MCSNYHTYGVIIVRAVVRMHSDCLCYTLLHIRGNLRRRKQGLWTPRAGAWGLQCVPQILKSQCPSTFTIENRHREYFSECVECQAFSKLSALVYLLCVRHSTEHFWESVVYEHRAGAWDLLFVALILKSQCPSTFTIESRPREYFSEWRGICCSWH